MINDSCWPDCAPLDQAAAQADSSSIRDMLAPFLAQPVSSRVTGDQPRPASVPTATAHRLRRADRELPCDLPWDVYCAPLGLARARHDERRDCGAQAAHGFDHEQYGQNPGDDLGATH